MDCKVERSQREHCMWKWKKYSDWNFLCFISMLRDFHCLLNALHLKMIPWMKWNVWSCSRKFYLFLFFIILIQVRGLEWETNSLSQHSNEHCFLLFWVDVMCFIFAYISLCLSFCSSIVPTPVLSLLCYPIVYTCSVFSPWLVWVFIPCFCFLCFIIKSYHAFIVLLSLSSVYGSPPHLYICTSPFTPETL